MGDNRKAEYAMAPTSDPENPPEKTDQDGGETASDDKQWSGLGKEELLRVADTPAWNWTRNVLLVLFWVAWVVMLIVAIVIVVKVPRCPETQWWESNVVQQVLPRSFRDSDNDGFGDLAGIKSKLDYLASDLGVTTLYLSSIFKQHNESTDMGQEIIDFMDVDEKIGTLEDFDDLIKGIQEKNMKIILEFVPNHSSDKHQWFKESMKSKDNDYSDYYVWADGQSSSVPPNGWVNKNGESAWTYVAERDQFYYHWLSSSQPDINYNNPNVTQKMKDALTFWLKDKKVDGFVFTGIDYLVEAPITSVGNRRRRAVTDTMSMVTEETPLMTEVEPTSEPVLSVGGGGGESPVYSATQYDDSTLDKLHEIIKGFATVLHDASFLGKYRVFITEHANGAERAAQFYENGGKREADFILNGAFATELNDQMDGYKLNEIIYGLLDAKKENRVAQRWNSWMLGNSELSRIRTRAPNLYRAFQMILLTLPGTPFNYYGDELGLEDIIAPANTDSRNAQRGPFPWGNNTNANFSDIATVVPWLPVAKNFMELNAMKQLEKKDSDLNLFKKLAQYHQEPSLVAGFFNVTKLESSVFAYVREYPQWPKYLVVINFESTKQMAVNVHNEALDSEFGHVMLSTVAGKDDTFQVNLKELTLQPYEAILITF